MHRLDTILVKLGEARRRLLRAADAIAPDQWKAAPRQGGWSGGELVSHLIAVERGVLRSADHATQKEPRKIPMLRRFHLPIRLVEARLVRRKTPIPVDKKLVGGKEEMLAELREVRGRTLAFLDETKGKNLSLYRWKHPFLGVLDVYDWFQFVASHEIRHSKQMREIATELPKVIESLQN